MAVVEMKKIALLGLKKDKQRLLKRMQHLGCVEITPGDTDAGRVGDAQSERGASELTKRIARLDLTIARLSPYDKNKPGLLSVRPEATPEQVASVLGARGEAFETVSRVEEIERKRGELRARDARDQALLEQLRPWTDVDAPLEKLGETKRAAVLLITVPQKAWSTFEAAIAQLPATALDKISDGREGVNALLARHQSDAESVDALMREAGVNRVAFEGLTGTVALNIDQIEGRAKRADDVRAQLQAEIEKLAGELPVLRLLRDVEATERERLESSLRCYDTKSAFLLTGWAPASDESRITEALKKVSPDCQIEFTDPAPEEKPPTVMKNGKYVSPFESIVKMFSLPDPNGIDPTFIMMPFWVCFFGMMLSDAGYGIVLGLSAGFVWWKLRGKGLGQMAFVLAMGGLSTIIWGAIYGGWFGVTVPYRLLDPMNDAIKVLIVCVGAGAVHLLTGLGVAAYMNIKRGKPWDALFDQGFWVLLLAGLGLMLVSGDLGKVLAIAGALGILFTAGRNKPGNIFKKITSGLGALYGISGYLSDLLSYARLFGMGLATGVIGMVVNMLAGLLMGTWYGWIFAIIILVGLHTFNLFINALGAYVHSCRLQYIEFFNKFYESGGKDFHPLAKNTRYVDIPDTDL